LKTVSQLCVSRRLLVRVTRMCTRTSGNAPTSSHRAVMTDAATIQAVRLFPAVLQRVSAVPLPPAVHRIRAVQLRQVPAVLLRPAVHRI
ncbi:MAG TPA: hypothetical protein DCX79_00985, partial [Planctomycetaceae bacterium]|nr:hypothetical protein [Planctomycetaceae bacterium]